MALRHLKTVKTFTSSIGNKRLITTVKLPDLSYDYHELEPVISAEIMQLHHAKHHQTYVNNFNKAMEQYAKAESKNDIAAMIALEKDLKFNGGGHVNHSIFWTNLAPPKKGGGGEPTGEIAELIKKEFGSFNDFKKHFNTKTAAVQGSGWGWLGYCKEKKKISFTTCVNQDPLSTHGLVPLLGIDVWEHAYYLQYKNVRPDYLENIWKIVNWKNVSERLSEAKKN